MGPRQFLKLVEDCLARLNKRRKYIETEVRALVNKNVSVRFSVAEEFPIVFLEKCGGIVYAPNLEVFDYHRFR